MQNSHTPKHLHLQQYSIERQHAPLYSKRRMCTEAFYIWNSVKAGMVSNTTQEGIMPELCFQWVPTHHLYSYSSPWMSDQYIIYFKVLGLMRLKFSETCQLHLATDPILNPVQTCPKMFYVSNIWCFRNCWDGLMTTLSIRRTKEMPAVIS